MNEFGELLKSCRAKCHDRERNRPLTQERLAELLSIESGVETYTGSTVSNWERGLNKIRRDDRHVLVGLIKVLHEGRGIENPKAANKLLLAGNYRPLDDGELREVNPSWEQHWPIPSAAYVPSAVEQEALLPAPSYSRLFGVEELVQDVIEQLISSHSRMIVLTGISGVGKTAVAHITARRAIEKGLFSQVVWVSAEFDRDNSRASEGIHGLINKLCQCLLPEDDQRSQLSQRLTRLRYKLHAQPHLIVIDDLGHLAEMLPLLASLLGIIGTGKYLLTAYQQPPFEIEATTISVPELSFDDSRALLNHQAELTRVHAFRQAEEKDIRDLYSVVGGHPLALRLIPRLARMYSLPEILEGWQTAQTGQIADIYQSVYDDLWHTLLPVEKQLMRVMPFVSQAGATLAYLQAVSNLPQELLRPSLTKLMECCLVEPHGNLYERRYGTHRLTIQYILSRLHAAESGDFSYVALIENALIYWQTYFAQLSEKEWHSLDQEQDNLALVLQKSQQLRDDEITLLIRTAWQDIFAYLFRYIEQRGYAAKWLPLLKDLTEKFADQPSERCRILNRLGTLYRLNHQLPEALELHHHVLTLAQQAEEIVEIAQVHLSLGNDYLLNRQYDKAIEHGTIALAQYDSLKLLGRERAATLNLLGIALRRQDSLEQSGHYLQEAAAIWRNINLWPELARTLHNLALVLQAQGDIDGAEKSLSEANHVLTNTASQLDRILIYLAEGAIHFQQKQYYRAEIVFKQINLTYLQDSGHTYYLAAALNNMGNAAYMKGGYAEAEQMLRQSIQHWQHLAEPLEMANSLGRLGDVLIAQAKQRDGELVFREAITLLEKYDTDGRMVHLKEELKTALSTLEEGEEG